MALLVMVMVPPMAVLPMLTSLSMIGYNHNNRTGLHCCRYTNQVKWIREKEAIQVLETGIVRDVQVFIRLVSCVNSRSQEGLLLMVKVLLIRTDRRKSDTSLKLSLLDR